MNQKKFRSLLQLDEPLYKKQIRNSLLFFGIFQLLLCVTTPYLIYRNLFEYDITLKRKVLSSTIAELPSEHLQGMLFPLVLYGFLLIAFVLPAIFIYRSYIDSKSMYTLMRLPSSRTYYFLAKLLPSYILAFFVWLLELLLILFYFAMYHWIIPTANLPAHPFIQLFEETHMQIFYPIYHPERFLCVIALLISIPTLSLLLTCAERSKKSGLFSLPIILANLICIYLYVTTISFPFWILPCATILTVLTARLYIRKIQIV